MTKSNAMNDFTTQISDFLKSEGLSITAAARRIGMDHGNLSRILSGQEGVTLERAERIANALGAQLTVQLQKISKIGAA
jgi:plasmid maintenance system antidote protein VapI